MYEGKELNNVVQVKAEWVKTKNKYSKSGISGGYDIVKSPKGHPEINGGFRTPDFSEWTVQRIRDTIKNSTSVDVLVTVYIIKDEREKRKGTLDEFFEVVS
jgi:hypothetical protein